MEPKRYLLFASLAYAYPILRPLQAEIRRRGGTAAWFLEEGCPDRLEAAEVRLHTVREVLEYDPVAVLAPGNHIPDFFPGVKVQLPHGYPINKRGDARDDHFTIRGWFDIYCTQGPSSTGPFREQERRYGHFRVYETGWPKADTYFSPGMRTASRNERPTILYSSTFTRGLTSTPLLADEIERLAETAPWDWIFMFHPKLTDPEILKRYESIAARHAHVSFLGNTFDAEAMRRADAMLCDSSSIILEFMFLDKPVVTFRNSHPGPWLLDVREVADVEGALARALTRPEALMEAVRAHALYHEPHRDGRCAARVLDAVDDFRARGHVGLKPKPLAPVRKWKMRRRMRYYPLWERLMGRGR